jgi:hypothetical protein
LRLQQYKPGATRCNMVCNMVCSADSTSTVRRPPPVPTARHGAARRGMAYRSHMAPCNPSKPRATRSARRLHCTAAHGPTRTPTHAEHTNTDRTCRTAFRNAGRLCTTLAAAASGPTLA